MTKVRARKIHLDGAILEDDGSGQLTLRIDTNMEVGPSGLRPAPGGITNAMLAGSIELTKMVDSLTLLRRDQNENVTGVWDFDLVPTIGAEPIATVAQVQAAAAGLDPKGNCEVKTDGDIATDTGVAWVYDNGTAGVGATLTAQTTGALTIDGFAGLEVGDRVLLADDTIWNGIYEITTLGDVGVAMVLTRSTDFDGSPSNEIEKGHYTFVAGGVVNQGTGWSVSNAGPFTVGTDPINFALFLTSESTEAGSGLTKIGTTISAVVSDFILGGSAQLDGDKLAILRTPSNYAPDTGDAQVTDVDHLSAHLRGIDLALGSVVETDPVVGAVNGLVKANGGGIIAAAVANTDYQVPPSEGAFADGDKTNLDNATTHVSDATLHLTADQNDAIDGANAPSAANVLLTADDLSAELPTPTAGDETKLLQAQATAGGYTVSGAGEPGVDGLYVETGTHNTKPLYINQSNADFSIHWDPVGPTWIIDFQLLEDPLYYESGFQDTPTPPSGASWTNNSGLAPAPTVVLAAGDPAWAVGPKVVSTDVGSAAGDILDRAAGDERWANQAPTSYQVLHVVTAGDVSAGFFTLANNPTEPLAVKVELLNGVTQLHKQTIDIGAETPDFDVLNTNEVHINNNGSATGLSGLIVENDKLLITYIG